MRSALLLLPLLLALAPASAARREPPLAIVGARILPVSGDPIENGTVVIEDGKIAVVGPAAKVDVPPGADRIPGRGLVVMPGLVDPVSTAGLTGQRPGGGTSPDLSPLVGLDPASGELRVLRRAGYTTLVLTREGGGVPGTGAAIRTAGDSVKALTLEREANLRMTAGDGTQAIQGLRKILEAANAEVEQREKYEKALAAYRQKIQEHQAKVEEAKKKGEKPPEAPKDLTAPDEPRENPRFGPVRRAVRGEIPLFVRVDNASQLLHFGEVTEGFAKLRVVVLYAAGDSARIVDTLKERKWSVVLPPALPTEPWTRILVNVPARLAAAGVPFAFSPPRDPDDLFLALGLLVRAGLPADVALAAVTKSPAELAGIGKRVGTIEKGKDGDLLVLDGDPLAATTRVVRVILGGRTVWPEEER